MTEADKHTWQVGDLCFCDGIAAIVWRVIDIEPRSSVSTTLWIKPIFSTMRPGCSAMRTREIDSTQCLPLTIIDLCQIRSDLDMFVVKEAKRLGSDAPVMHMPVGASEK